MTLCTKMHVQVQYTGQIQEILYALDRVGNIIQEHQALQVIIVFGED